VITRVVDYGGLFHDDIRAGHKFAAQDHRAFRPAGWVEAGLKKIEQMRDIAAAHDLTILQLACLWNLSQPAVHSVIPTFIQESNVGTKSIEAKIEEVATLPEMQLAADEIERMTRIGDNTGCMTLKGASAEHEGEPQPDRWPLNAELIQTGKRWEIDPLKHLVCTHG